MTLTTAIRHIRHRHGGMARASWLSAWLLVGGLLLTGCSADMPDSPANRDVTEVTLSLNVAVADNGQKLTRPTIPADSDNPQDGDFQEPANNAEKIHTLRVIIVAADGIVEHNRLVTCDQNGNPINDNLRFLVKTETQQADGSYPKKDIYLFANERAANAAIYESLKSLISSEADDFNPDPTLHEGLPFDLIRTGRSFPTALVNGIVFGREAGQPLISVTADESNGVVTIPATEDQYIPMSEHFQLEVSPATATPAVEQPGVGSSRYEQTATLFVTRAATKFTFTGILGNGYPEDTELRITEITISNIADKEYLLPQATVYSPTKDFAIIPGNSYEGLIITGYRVPSETGNSGFTFRPTDFRPQASDYSKPEGQPHPGVFISYDYFPESPMIAAYEVTLKGEVLNAAGNVMSDVEFGPVKLEGLQTYDNGTLYGLPRNTHVYINFTFYDKDHNVALEARLMPYIGITLPPVFGFDEWVDPPTVTPKDPNTPTE